MNHIDTAIRHQIERIVAEFHDDEFTTGKVQQGLLRQRVELDEQQLEDFLSSRYRSALLARDHWWDRRWRPLGGR